MRIGSKSRVLVAVLLGLASPGSQSGIVSADDPAPAEDAGTHCASEAVPVGSNRTPGPPVCFDSFPDAISYATSGAVELPDGATTVTQQQLDQGAARPNGAAAVKVVIGVSHDGLDWPESPGTLTHWVWNRGCDADPGRSTGSTTSGTTGTTASTQRRATTAVRAGTSSMRTSRAHRSRPTGLAVPSRTKQRPSPGVEPMS
jgi:hypothetical protein